MCSPAVFTFIFYSSEDLKDVPKIISELFIDIENGKYKSSTKKNVNEAADIETIFNTKEACSYLNIAKSTIYKLTSNNAISFYKPNGKNMYFKKGDLDDYLTQVKHISNSDLEAKTNDYLSRNWKL